MFAIAMTLVKSSRIGSKSESYPSSGHHPRQNDWLALRRSFRLTKYNLRTREVNSGPPGPAEISGCPGQVSPLDSGAPEPALVAPGSALVAPESLAPPELALVAPGPVLVPPELALVPPEFDWGGQGK